MSIFNMGNTVLRGPDRYIYKDNDGYTHEYESDYFINRIDEVEFVSKHDKEKLYGGDEAYIISSHWLNKWIEYAKGSTERVGPIDNYNLVQHQSDGTYVLKPDMHVKVDFRPVNKAVWEFYFKAYGGGPVIGFHVPTGLDLKLYKSGKWVEHCNVKFDRIVTVVVPDSTGTAKLSLEYPMDVSLLLSGSLCNLAVQHLMGGSKQQKLKEGQAMEEDVTALNMAAIGSMMSNSGHMGKVMVCKAKSILQQAEEDNLEGLHLEATKQLLQSGSAMVIQHNWRCYTSRRKFERTKERRKELLINGAARSLQRIFRIHIATKKLSHTRLKMKESSSASVVQRCVRGFISRRRVLHMIRCMHPHNYILTLKHARDLPEGESIVQDPYVVVAAYRVASRSSVGLKASDLPPGLTGSKTRRGSHTETRSDGKLTLLSYYTTRAPVGSTSPVWDERTFITGAPWNAKLVLTYFDANKLGRDTCIGQNVIDLKDLRPLYNGKTMDFTDFPVKSYTVPVRDPQDNLLVPAGVRPRKGKGTVSFSLRLPPVTESMSGWILRASTSFMTPGQFKRRWMILVDRTLHCFEDPFTLNVPKGIMRLECVTVVEKQVNGTIIVSTENDRWVLRWDTSENKKVTDMWERKFWRALPPNVVESMKS